MVGLYGHERRTLILGADEVEEFVFADDPVLLEIGDDPCVLTLSATGVMGREPLEGAKRGTFGRHDVLAARIETTNHATVTAVTTGGRACTVQGMEVPEGVLVVGVPAKVRRELTPDERAGLAAQAARYVANAAHHAATATHLT